MRLLFCGVRGSTPAPGREHALVGGHTSCVALAHDDGPWSLVFDAGTGIRRLSSRLGGDPFAGTLLLTHLHWDHVQGLPFFAAGDRADARVRVVMPRQAGASAADVLARAMSPPHFPIGPDGLRGSWTFEGIDPGSYVIEGFRVVVFEVPHKGGRTFGFRVTEGDVSIAYVPDHLPDPQPGADLASGIAGVDLLVHDAQFLADERAVADDYGHATVDDAVRLAVAAGAGSLALFHHAPGRTDAEIDAIGRAAAGRGVEVVVAREELELEIGRSVAPA